MQLITQNSTNRFYFTATENMVSGAWCYLNIHHVATDTNYFYAVEKINNLSAFTGRFDAWDIAIGNIPAGQCLYTLYEGNAGATQPTDEAIIGVLETGLYEVLASETTDSSFSNSVTYYEPNI